MEVQELIFAVHPGMTDHLRILCGYCIFNLYISKELESGFLALEYQKHTLIGTIEHYIVNTEKYSGVLLSCDMCEIEIIIIILKTLTCFTNILLNDYTTT